MSQTSKKMPAPPKADWKKSLGSFDAFHKAAEASVGKEAEKIHNEALRSFASTHSLSEALQSSLESEVDAFVGGDEHNTFHSRELFL